MRFDDSLATVLAADTGSASGAAAAWRQLVDLIGRRRTKDIAPALVRLRELRDRVPAAVRGASGRALAMADPPASLVALFAEDELATAAPVLRTATLDAADWLALLPKLSPTARAVLRHRRDLPGEVARGLESFGATDFVLGHDSLPEIAIGPVAQVAASVAPEPIGPPQAIPAPAPLEPRFEIADLVARIDAFRRDQPEPVITAPPPAPDCFQFHADAAGVIRWVEGVARTPLVGVALGVAIEQGLATVGAEAGMAVARRRPFRDATLAVAGTSSAAGLWRLSGEPRFDRVNGRFAGMAGIARRVADAAPVGTAADSLRELVHELRTPANAIAGFAELIGSELLGPVAPVYRDRAWLIQRQGNALTEAIADLDTAARIEGSALETRPAPLDLAALAARAVADLQGVAQSRHLRLTMMPPPAAAMAQTDDRAARRLVERLLAATVAAALPGERLTVQLVAKSRTIRLHVTRPQALPAGDDRLLAIDGEEGSDELLLLGIGFTLRLVRGLADALGGSLTVSPERLTLRLPAAVTAMMEQAAAH